jgi:group I intron endonuclease
MIIDYSWLKGITARKNKFRKMADTTGKSVTEQLQEMQNKTLLSGRGGKSGIYIFHSKINDFIYIGSATNLEKRRLEHIDGLVNNEHLNIDFQILYHKHGLDNLTFYIVEYCPPNDCLNRERELILEWYPEINIAGVKELTLGSNYTSMNEMQEVREAWLHTREGFEWQREKVFDWANKGVGKTITKKDMKNMWNKLSTQNMTEDEKVAAILYDYKVRQNILTGTSGMTLNRP